MGCSFVIYGRCLSNSANKATSPPVVIIGSFAIRLINKMMRNRELVTTILVKMMCIVESVFPHDIKITKLLHMIMILSSEIEFTLSR